MRDLRPATLSSISISSPPHAKQHTHTHHATHAITLIEIRVHPSSEAHDFERALGGVGGGEIEDWTKEYNTRGAHNASAEGGKIALRGPTTTAIRTFTVLKVNACVIYCARSVQMNKLKASSKKNIFCGAKSKS